MIVDLKRLALDDMDRAALVLRASFDERLPWLAGLHTPAEDRAFFRDHVYTACEFFGAMADGRLLGILALRPGWIDQLYVLPDQQRRGVGTALLALAQARSTALQLWTFQRNSLARRFYESHGFVAVKQTDGSRNEEREPDVLYRWARAV